MESECSLPRSQQAATYPYPKPHQCNIRPTNLFQIHFNSTLSSTSISSRWTLSLTSPHQSPVCMSPSQIHATCSAHIILLNLITRKKFGEQYRSLNSSLCSFLLSPVTSSLLGTNIYLSTLFSNTLSLCSSLSVSDQVSHPYKTKGKVTN